MRTTTASAPPSRRFAPPRPPSTTGQGPDIADLRDGSISDSTWKAYLMAWNRWSAWADAQHRPALPANSHDVGLWAHSCAFPPTTRVPEPATAAGFASAADPASTPVSSAADPEPTEPIDGPRRGRRRGRPRASGPMSVSTMTKHMAALAYIHRRAGHPSPFADPALRNVMDDLHRQMAARQPPRRHIPPLLTQDIEKILAAMDDSPTGGQSLTEVRDRALLLLAFASALRSSELAALNIEDLQVHPDGLLIRVPSPHPTQPGTEPHLAITWAQRPDLCPIRAIDTWLHRLQQQLTVQDAEPLRARARARARAQGSTRPISTTSSRTTRAAAAAVVSPADARRRSLPARRRTLEHLHGAVLRAIFHNGRVGSTTVPDPHQARMSPLAIAQTITARAQQAGLQAPAGAVGYYTAHSTRAGFAIQAAANGTPERDIMAHGRWISREVAREYLDRAEVFRNSPAGRLGL